MTVITLSREYGAGGHVIGPRVAELLGIDFLDTELILEVARRLHVSSETVRQWDERSEGLIMRLLRSLQSAHPEYASASPVASEAMNPGPDPERIWAVVQELIREEARSRSAVILGRGGAFILAHWPGAFHVRLIAPRDARIRRVAEVQQLEYAEAARKVDLADKERDRFVHDHFRINPAEPHHYALVVNTDALGFEGTAQIITQASGGVTA